MHTAPGCPPDFLTAAEVADIIRSTPWFVTEQCRSGKLRATKPGKAWLIARADLDEYLDANRNDAA